YRFHYLTHKILDITISGNIILTGLFMVCAGDHGQIIKTVPELLAAFQIKYPKLSIFNGH
ncbi:hypothetical protein ACJX0J_022796, partial [Zea mays]